MERIGAKKRQQKKFGINKRKGTSKEKTDIMRIYNREEKRKRRAGE